MTRVSTVANRISTFEGFRIVVTQSGEPVDENLQGALNNIDYNHNHRARNTWNVARWKERRFEAAYPNYSCNVLDGEGNVVHGNTNLGNLRASYAEVGD